MAAVKAQTAFEFLLIFSALMVVLLILTSINFEVLSSHQNQIKLIKAKDTINELYKGCNLVYKEGKGSKIKVFINVPSSVEATSLDNNLMLMNVTVAGSTQSIFRKVPFDVIGAIPEEKGYYWVNVTSLGSQVEITY